MSHSWTPEQKQVIRERGRDILVSAAAGSGKTAVLVERIIAKITDPVHPVDIDRILVVTFTSAAAAQMRERILERLERASEAEPENQHLARQVTLVHHAQITTIHSFCMYVIRNHFHEIDLDPDFRMAEEGEITLLLSQVMDEMLEEQYEERRPEFLHFMDAYAIGGRERPVRDMILSLHRFAESYPWPDSWLDGLREPYDVSDVQQLQQAPWVAFAFSLARSQIAGAREETMRLLELCLRPDGPACYAAGLQRDIEDYDRLLAASDFVALQRLFADQKYAAIGSSRGFSGDMEQLEYVKAARDGLKKMVTNIRDDFFSQTPEEMAALQRRQLPYVEELIRLTKTFRSRFDAKKRRKNILDFGDLEHLALKILVDEETGESRSAAEEFIRYFDEIMIDEYQDSNYIQEAILSSVSRNAKGGHNRFMVGDVKQSIYRFRLARPEIFMEKYQAYSAGGEGAVRIDLRKNFRSRPEVLSFANDLFYPLMQADLGNVTYDRQAALYPGAEDYPPCDGMFDTQILLGESDEEGWEDAAIEDRNSLEAKMVADEIRSMMAAQMVTDDGTRELRPVEYRDMVILMRSPKSIGESFAKVLAENGIPTHLDSSTGYFTSMEVELVLQALQVLDNPWQDIPLAAVLHSPMFGFSNDELALIRGAYGQIPFHRAFFAYAGEHRGDKKIEKFCTFLDDMRRRISDTSIRELIEELLERTGFLEYVTVLPGGKARRANLERLMDEAVAYESTSYRGLFHFVNYISRLQKYEVDLDGADMAGEDRDVVRIMSIHKSKGLEFPVVFVCGLGRSFNRQDSRQLMVLHSSQGMAFDEIDPVRHVKNGTVYKRTLAKALDMDTLGEELRILYVAVTRAKEKLVLTGVCQKAAEKLAGWRQEETVVPLWKRLHAKSFMEWIVMSLSVYRNRYQIRLVMPSDLLFAEVAEQADRMARREALVSMAGASMQADGILSEASAGDADVAAEVERGLSYVYPYPANPAYKNKYSVSEMKHRAIEQIYLPQEAQPMFLKREKEPHVPAFISKKQEGSVWQGALRGTATHRYLECFDFAREDYAKTYAAQLEEMRAQGKLTGEQAQLLQADKITAFLESALAARMSAAAGRGQLYVEKAFVLGSTAEELFGEADGAFDEMILVQGIIDVFFEEADGMVLLDYKTDRVFCAQELAGRYRAQLELYAKAIERTAGRRVKQKYLYSFALQEVIEV